LPCSSVISPRSPTMERSLSMKSVMLPVVLSVAKDLIAACHRHKILRFAQDDGGASSQP
jgi:hypothetical protein